MANLIALSGLLLRPFGERGLHQVLNRVLLPRARDDVFCTLHLRCGASYRFPINDPYWARLLSPWYRYEPELWLVLDAASRVGFDFLDGGANLGYWSAIASSDALGAKAVAVEALPTTLSQLRANAELNSGRFAVVEGALSDRVGDRAAFHFNPTGSPSNASASLTPLTRLSESVEVVTTTLDKVAEDHDLAAEQCLVKLDVEGAEDVALRGGMQLAKRGAVFVFEDHGRDTSCRAILAFLEAGMDVYHVGGEGQLVPIRGRDDGIAVKQKPHKGYNFLSGYPDSRFLRHLRSALTDGDRVSRRPGPGDAD